MIALLIQASDDSGEVRDELGRILARREYNYKQSALSRFFEWLLEQISKLIPDRNPNPAMPVAGPGLVSVIVAVILVSVAVVIIVLAIRAFLRRRPRQDGDDEGDEPTVSLRPNVPSDDWLDGALDLERAGDWKGSVLIRYRRLVSELEDRELVESIPGLTPGELREDLVESLPEATNLFSEANRIFEDPWFGDLPTGEAQVDRLVAVSDEIVSAADRRGSRG